MTLGNKNNYQFYPSLNHANYNNNLLTNISIGAMATQMIWELPTFICLDLTHIP